MVSSHPNGRTMVSLLVAFLLVSLTESSQKNHLTKPIFPSKRPFLSNHRMINDTTGTSIPVQGSSPRIQRQLSKKEILQSIQQGLTWGIHNSRRSPLVGGLLQDVLNQNNVATPKVEPQSVTLVVTRGGSATKTRKKKSSSKTKTKDTSKSKTKKSDRPCVLSATKPFFSPEQIGQLTLTEVGKAFDYAVQRTRPGFDGSKFQPPPILSKLFQAMDQAAATSRGTGVSAALTGTGTEPLAGDVDTLLVCAAARILSEWRLVRQIPEGHQRYASSMTLGHKDVVQNIRKMETAAHDYIEHLLSQPSPQSPLSSPTLRQLLQFEINQDYHPVRPKLQEVSGAMGLLWVRRQLQFQTTFYQNLLDIPTRISGPAEALAVAYDHVYMNFHKWATQKIFRYTMQEGPEIHEVYQCMNPQRRAVEPVAGVPNEMPAEREQRMYDALEDEAHTQIRAFVKEMQPVLDDLAALFDEFNMNDPKKA